ncbi:MAG: hypothetical protein DRK00_09045, partial [Thermoprotei archaeon]
MINKYFIIAFTILASLILLTSPSPTQPLRQCALTHGSTLVYRLGYSYSIRFGSKLMNAVTSEATTVVRVVGIEENFMTLESSMEGSSSIQVGRPVGARWKVERREVEYRVETTTVVDTTTFKVVSQEGYRVEDGERKSYKPIPSLIGSYYWVPPGLRVGDSLPLGGLEYTIVGEGRYTAAGRTFDCWILERWEETGYSTALGKIKFRVTSYADKRTGIVVATKYELVAPRGLGKYGIGASGGGLYELVEYHNVAWDCKSFGDYVNPCVTALVVEGDEGLEELKSRGIVTGSGAPGDPYVIHGCTIEISDKGPTVGIEVRDTRSYLVIESCRITGPGPVGIRLVNVRNVVVKDCYIERTHTAGVEVEASGSVEVVNTQLVETGEGDGVYAKQVESIVVRGVSSSNSEVGGEAWFIRLEEVNGGIISHNSVVGYYGGILISASRSLEVRENVVQSCERGIYLVSGSTGNLVYDNRFEASENYRVEGEGNRWYVSKRHGLNIVGGSYIGGNYWSDYSGEDLDGDGIGDTEVPYGPGDMLPLVMGRGGGAGGVPDIVVREEDVAWSPTRPSRGDYVQFRVTVHNEGDVETGWFSVVLVLTYVDETTGASHTAEFYGNCTLGPGEAATIYLFSVEGGMGFRIPSDMGNGSAYVAVGADYLDEVEEVDEGNNGVVKRFNLYERGPSTPPNETRVDLEVEVGRVLGRFTRGGYASIEFLVHNHGPEIPLNYLDYVRVEYWSNLSAVHQTASLYSLVVDEYPDARGLQSWRCNVVIGIPFYDSWVKALEFRIRVSSSVIHDTNPTNDEDSAVIVLEEGRPDLAIQYIRISPDPVRAGEGFSVVVGVVNMGYGTAAAGFRVRVFEGHPILERDLTVGVDIPSGESCDIVLQYGPEVWEQLASFPSTFCSIVDVDDVVEEEVEGNNEKCLVLDLPNLEWSRIELDGTPTGISITVPDNTVASFTAFIAAVLPPGQLETGGFRARVVLREAEGGRLVYEEEFEIASMTRGEERVVNVEVPFGGAGGGDYLLEFQLDVDNAVAESDEEDNVR